VSARTFARSAPGGAAAPLLHWLVLVSGLALLATGRSVETDAIGPLCLGAISGTATGQFFAWLRLRAWSAIFATICVLSIGAIGVWNLWSLHSSSGSMFEAFVPAAACGYLSWTARGALAGFWFPAVPWTLAILEADASDEMILGPSSVATSVGSSWVLWVGLGGLLLATLWARETRRVAQWKTHALVDLAAPPTRAVLREAPLRAVGRGAWTVAVGGATVLVAAWIAPLLWQSEAGDAAAAKRRQAVVPPASVAATGVPGAWVTCCPEAPPPEPTQHVREYFTPRQRRVVDVPPLVPTSCVACVDGVPHRGVPAGTPYTSPAGRAEEGDGGATMAADGYVPPAADTQIPLPAATLTVEPLPSATFPARPEHDVVAHAPATQPPAPTPRVEPGTPLAGPSSPQVARNPPSAHSYAEDFDDTGDETSDFPLVRGLLALLVAAAVGSLILRPVRRWFVLRHLRRPWWQETVSQRVSNLWQLSLIGLRDAGWHAESGEPPQDLARRVGVEGMRVCAEVLDRARHGVRVDAEDLAAMERAAATAFAAAHQRAGALARLVSWWRAPLG
jgi:hypothetical protein